MATNRVFHRFPCEASAAAGGRHPTWYGVPFELKNEATWGTPDDAAEVSWETRAGRKLTVKLQRWHDLLMPGKRDAPMHQRPFDLIRCQVQDAQGQPVFKKTLWLLVLGKRRREVSTVVAYEAYRQRYDMEHFFRFGKNRLLLDRLQTPDLAHEESWWELVCLAYASTGSAQVSSLHWPRRCRLCCRVRGRFTFRNGKRAACPAPLKCNATFPALLVLSLSKHSGVWDTRPFAQTTGYLARTAKRYFSGNASASTDSFQGPGTA